MFKNPKNKLLKYQWFVHFIFCMFSTYKGDTSACFVPYQHSLTAIQFIGKTENLKPLQ